MNRRETTLILIRHGATDENAAGIVQGQLQGKTLFGMLGKKDAFKKGTTPFNRFIQLEGRKTKVCSWVHDLSRIDPVDSDYVISDDTFTKLHRGMRMDEVLLHKRLLRGDAGGTSFSDSGLAPDILA